MKHTDAQCYWDGNAATWTKQARAGYDVYRYHLNTPAFFRMLPDVAGLWGLDIGCGEGHNTRLLADQGARVVGLDISAVFVDHAQRSEELQPKGVDYLAASAVQLPFAGAIFDFATTFMSFMDIAETESVIAEACRVLKPGGSLQFSIPPLLRHPTPTPSARRAGPHQWHRGERLISQSAGRYH